MAKFSTKKLGKQLDKWSSGYYSSGYKASNTSYSQSSFWLDDDFLTKDTSLSLGERKTLDYVKLAGYSRAIGNFVRIVTGKDDIPVRFSSGNQSYTDGQSVVISSKLDDSEFDSTVGLALHEGSHIALTDFEYVKKVLEYPNIWPLADWYNYTTGNDIHEGDVIQQLKTLINIVEDRRIDRYIYDSAPGYRGYYQSLYDKYFNAPEIDQALLSGKKSDPCWENYEFHICNFANPKRQLNALPGLRDIWNIIDLLNISRLKDTQNVVNVCVDVWKRIAIEINLAGDANKNGNSNSNGNGSGESQENNIEVGPAENEEMGNGGMPNLDVAGNQMSDKDSKKAAKEEAALQKAIQKQKDFLEGNIKKKNVSKVDLNKIKAIADSDMKYERVGTEEKTWNGGGTVDCLVVKGVKPSMWENNLLHDHCQDPDYLKRTIDKHSREDYVQQGIELGKLLGKRLKTRDEERTLKNTRLETGRIDRRLIAELGFGNEKVFANTFHKTSTPALVHITLDASGSMSGNKWAAAMRTSIAIAKAATMVSSLDCIISVRGSVSASNGQQPLMWIIYDSRKDSFKSSIRNFYSVRAAGSTPEGLCYQAVMRDIIKSAAGKDSYLINICDGEPTFSGAGCCYSGDYAANHTAGQVKKMREAGINILSFFADDGYYNESAVRRHKYMYGKDAMTIDLTNLSVLAKSLNTLFERSNG